MRSENIQKSVIYRFRHLFVFALLIALATTLITYKFWILPNGLSAAEMASLTQSGHFSPALLLSNFSEHLDWIVDLPWTIMQWLSLQVFGISTFALRLPAVFLGILSAVGFILVLRKWFMTNVAMATAMLAITSPIFISIARSGSSSIMTVFLSVVALYAATVILYSNSDKVGLKSLLAKVSASIAMALLGRCFCFRWFAAPESSFAIRSHKDLENSSWNFSRDSDSGTFDYRHYGANN